MLKKVIIVGAGIGGLCTALALAKQRISVTVIEQAPGGVEAGAGVQISPNASRILAHLGVLESVEALASAPPGIEMRNGLTGGLLFRSELAVDARAKFGAPYFTVHRADLHRCLLSAVRQSDAIDVRFATRCAGVFQTLQTASIRLESGEFLHADVIVGADGIKSTVQASLFGYRPPRFTGCVAWRGLVPRNAVPTVSASTQLWVGPGAHMVHYPLRGGDLVNFVAVTTEDWQEESWTIRAEKPALLDAFAEWCDPVKAVLDASDPSACYKWALFDRSPLPYWTEGRITLLGDACHPTLPFLAQGACMAIEDAAVLSACLSRYSSYEHALARYEQLRKPRTTSIQRASRSNEWLYHCTGHVAAARNLLVPFLRRSYEKRLSALYRFDALAQL